MSEYAVNVGVRGNNAVGVDQILDKPRIRVWNSVGLAGLGPGQSVIGYDTADWDSDSMNAGSPNLRCVTTGFYIATAGVQYSTGTGARQSFIRKTSTLGVTTDWAQTITPASAAGSDALHNLGDVIPLAQGDTIALYAKTFGDAANIIGGQSVLYLTATLISLGAV